MAKQKSYKGKKQYAMYEAEGRRAKNKTAKLARHAKRHPNDKQAQEKAKPGNFKSKPNEKKFTSTTRMMAQYERMRKSIQLALVHGIPKDDK